MVWVADYYWFIGLIGGTCLFSLVCEVVFWLDCWSLVWFWFIAVKCLGFLGGLWWVWQCLLGLLLLLFGISGWTVVCVGLICLVCCFR